jgi:hypothetical protein
MGTLRLGNDVVVPAISAKQKEIAAYSISADNQVIRTAADISTYFTDVTTITENAMRYAFNFSLDICGTVDFRNLSVVEKQGLMFAFVYTKINNIRFDNLSVIKESGLRECFNSCLQPTEISFPKLTQVESLGLFKTFDSCNALITAHFPALSTLDYGSMTGCFINCLKLEKVFFSALTAPNANCFMATNGANKIFSNCKALTEIHFKKGTEEIISAIAGYADKWGAPNATIYFDL